MAHDVHLMHNWKVALPIFQDLFHVVLQPHNRDASFRTYILNMVTAPVNNGRDFSSKYLECLDGKTCTVKRDLQRVSKATHTKTLAIKYTHQLDCDTSLLENRAAAQPTLTPVQIPAMSYTRRVISATMSLSSSVMLNFARSGLNVILVQSACATRDDELTSQENGAI